MANYGMPSDKVVQLQSGESRHLPSMWNMINAFQSMRISVGSRLTLVDYRDKTGCNLVD
ncbi:hypothetical protein HanRHA438_Chr13g0577201 [Helianthus annuus]|nr:hypothetical protein HanIR_Chr13g0616031 [Helianthus annuus]KAJ0856321.1 hypothetical protein HanRHA438_Chr13g0577201 [Helianthus annuus]